MVRIDKGDEVYCVSMRKAYAGGLTALTRLMPMIAGCEAWRKPLYISYFFFLLEKRVDIDRPEFVNAWHGIFSLDRFSSTLVNVCQPCLCDERYWYIMVCALSTIATLKCTHIIFWEKRFDTYSCVHLCRCGYVLQRKCRQPVSYTHLPDCFAHYRSMKAWTPRPYPVSYTQLIP